MRLLYRYDTRDGTFYIGERGGRFHPLFEDESLGSYPSARQAAEDLAAGRTLSAVPGLDLASLDIPDELEDWEALAAGPARGRG
jgi:hypothetical protein